MQRSRFPDREEMRAEYPWCELAGVISDILDDAERGGRGAYLLTAVSVYYLIGLIPSLPLMVPVWLFTDVSSVGIWLIPGAVGLSIVRLGVPFMCRYRVREHILERGTWEAGDWTRIAERERREGR